MLYMYVAVYFDQGLLESFCKYGNVMKRENLCLPDCGARVSPFLALRCFLRPTDEGEMEWCFW